jgi:hypothetical protein
MAYSFDFSAAEGAAASAMPLDDYVAHMSEQVDVLDPESVKASAGALYRLSLNEGLLDDFIVAPLKDLAMSFQPSNRYSDAVFMLRHDPRGNFFIRANVWKAPRSFAGSRAHEEILYSYERAHDHNFDFLTVGYHGPGYRTRIYEYDPGAIVGEVGEPVDLRFLEDTMLPTGKVMMYRRSIDVHIQLPPPALSISLNMIVNGDQPLYNPQYSFDESGRLAGFVDGPTSDLVSFVELAGEIGHPDMIEPLLEIARSNPYARARANAAKSLLRQAPGERERLQAACGCDPSRLVREAIFAAG